MLRHHSGLGHRHAAGSASRLPWHRRRLPGSTGCRPEAQQQAPPLDEGRVQELNTILQSNPKNVDATIQLGNVYFDAEHWDDAIKWYGGRSNSIRRTPTRAPILA